MRKHFAAMLMLVTVDGRTAVIDPQAITAVWHANGRDWVAVSAGAMVQVADEKQVIEQWLHLLQKGVTLPLDPKTCGGAR